jgi:hypothetical protein
MADTIEWLETIGKSAKLRHASADDLAHTLEQVGASDALKAAVANGDSALLSAELGNKPMHTENDTHTHPRPPHHPHHPHHPDEHEDDEPAPHEDEPDQGEPKPR